jgi:hypothetical protein
VEAVASAAEAVVAHAAEAAAVAEDKSAFNATTQKE